MDAVIRVKQFFETLSRESVARIGEVYAPEVRFKDPFNDVHGLAAVERVFTRMFEQVAAPRFVIAEAVAGDGQAFLTWEFFFRLHGSRQTERCICGATHLRFAPDGRVCVHRDYWDVAEELYEKLPVLGGFMRFLRRRAAG